VARWSAARIGLALACAGQVAFLAGGFTGGFTPFDFAGTSLEILGFALAAAGARKLARAQGSGALAAGLGLAFLGRLVAWAPGAGDLNVYQLPGGVGLLGLAIAAWGGLRWSAPGHDSAARVVGVGMAVEAMNGFLWIPVAGAAGVAYLPADLLTGIGGLVAAWAFLAPEPSGVAARPADVA
jgi:hypothetical protein